jgi:uridine phosphorylase
MYHETTRETLIKHFELADEHAIDAGIILGIWNPERAMARWRDYLSNVVAPPQFHNLIFGERDGRRIGFGVAYGATFAADLARFCQLLGARTLIQIGFFGGLQPNMRRADFIVPTQSIRGDGASDVYLPRGEPLFASFRLSESIATEVQGLGSDVHRMPQLSIVGGILSETREQIAEWSACGYGGVDLETATTFAVAQRFGLDRAALLLCSDVIVEGDTLFHAADDDTRERYERNRLIMEDVALKVVCA